MRISGVVVFAFLISCSADTTSKRTLFTDVSTDSGITFTNQLTFTKEFNPYTYRNFFNGAGVAIGDINNDGLADIYFAGNQVGNKLYLNQGGLKFRDITQSAGVACAGVWSTGVTFADINADGLLDIYVCKSGNADAPHRYNELFINNGDLTFTEKSQEYGLQVTGLSVQAAFFDYDKDGDLDCYLLSNSIRSVGNYDLVKDQRTIPDPQGGGNKFFLNDGGHFRDFSTEAGIYRSNIGFGLGITLGDFNHDTWTDIFVSNDFFERDYLYINNQKGSFIESLTSYFESISMGSMGADYADLDNDGRPELFVTEMLPDSLSRKKTKTLFEGWNKYQSNVDNGYYHQFSRNVLQKEIGPGHFAEVGRQAGVASSEWSWGALLFDMDDDGHRDIFIANGIYKDLLDRDYLAFVGAEENVRQMIREEQQNAILKLIDQMPSSTFSNYAFRNEGQLRFIDRSKEWGLNHPSYSSGSAYGDLDNDGDLDLVINNINAPSLVYRNNTDTSRRKSLNIELSTNGKNTFAVGSQITATIGERTFVADNFVTRGFQSAVQPRIHIGLGDSVTVVDSLTIRWPDGGISKLANVPVGKVLTIKEENAGATLERVPLNTKPMGLLELSAIGVAHHSGSGLVDFDRERLLPMMYSNETPALLKGDLDHDGQDDIYMDEGRSKPGTVITAASGKFVSHTPKGLTPFALGEEVRGALFDADGDGDLDLYIATGGRFYPRISDAQKDRLMLNNGRGDFTESSFPLPFTSSFSTSVVTSIDFDNDKDLDLIVGDRGDPFTYGLGGRAYVLENDGKGRFSDVTQEKAPFLMSAGMVTDAVAADIDGDGWQDAVIVGDWMPIIVLKNTKGRFENYATQLGLAGTEGWWHAITAADLNGDGLPDFVVGNTGLNTFFKAGDSMYLGDFDGNGSMEQLFCTYQSGRDYPLADKDDLLSQLPGLKKSLLFYKDYAKRSIDDLFSKSVLEKARVFRVKDLFSRVLLSGPGGYRSIALPQEAQFSPIYALAIVDVDGDSVLDLIAGGNQYLVKPQFGRCDASNGWLFKGSLHDGQFAFQSGIALGVAGQIRGISTVEVNNKKYIFFAKYDDDLEIYKVR